MSSPSPSRFRLLRWLRGIALALALLGVVALAAFFSRFEIMRIWEGLPAFSHDAGPHHGERVAMRDGIRLGTQIFLPEGEGPWPTVLVRNPYDRLAPMLNDIFCGRFVRYGFGCVSQDVRGQGESEGEWNPLVNEGRDGRDTLDWLTKQPFQDGRLALVGPSYLAAVQWAVAPDFPADIRTIVPSVFSADLHGALYQDGMFRHETFTAWSAALASRGMQLEGAGEKYQKAIRHRPHIEVDEKIFGQRLEWYRDWISSPSPSSPLWHIPENERMISAPERLSIPVLMIGGWYDVFFGPQMKDWQRLATRSKSRFVVGPWNHIGQGGDSLETPDAGGGLMQWKILLDWLGHHLRGEPLENGPGVATYVMRENRWVERENWPPPSHAMRFYLDSLAEARNCDGGRLRAEPPSQEQSVRYRYDPDDPVPTRGGAGMLAFVLPDFGGAQAANVWQGDLCARADILSFVTEPMTAPLPIVGTIRVQLSVASDAPDTSFTTKLVELLPDGRAVNIRDGITTIAHRGNAPAPRPYRPGERVELEIPFWPIEWTVPRGSRLRLDVSSSDFPKYHSHPNRAGIWSLQDEANVAQQTLLAGPGNFSYLELPIGGEQALRALSSSR